VIPPCTLTGFSNKELDMDDKKAPPGWVILILVVLFGFAIHGCLQGTCFK
jgi:hypothetical protein